MCDFLTNDLVTSNTYFSKTTATGADCELLNVHSSVTADSQSLITMSGNADFKEQ